MEFIKFTLTSASFLILTGLFHPCLAQTTSPSRATEAARPWYQLPENRASVTLLPVRESTLTRDHVELAYKHFPRPGAQPLLMVHGLAQNDRGYDEAIAEYSMAKFFHSQGFDVWVGNCRGAGTPGFRSETPQGPHHWTVEDYALFDLPALVLGVRDKTGIAPFVIGHSLAAWALEGYLSGLTRTITGTVRPSKLVREARRQEIKGVITIAGVYNLWWTHRLADAAKNPLKSSLDFYKSNYEMELISKVDLLYQVLPNLPSLPLGWIGQIINAPLDKLPWIGPKLKNLYSHLQESAASTPLLSMFYYAPNTSPEVVRTHGIDGLEDLGPRLIEQLGNTLEHGMTLSYFHQQRPLNAFEYRNARRQLGVPMLFVAGGRDRLASAEMIYRDGYEMTETNDKEFLLNEEAGHLDILVGRNALEKTLTPMLRWLRSR